MTSFGGLGIGLSLVFSCLLLAIVGEFYYLLWWKKKTMKKKKKSSYAKEVLQLFFCWNNKSASSLHNTNNINNENDQGLVKDDKDCSVVPDDDLELGSSKDKDLLVKGFGEEGVEAELMRLHNLAGPPRFLFTIKEETNEDLESENGRSKRSFSELRLTPLASPPLKPSPLNTNILESYRFQGFNPLFESSTESELNKLLSSPPPKFKFLRSAEEKFLKRLMMELEPEKREQESVHNPTTTTTAVLDEETEGSFLKFIVGKNRESLQYLQPCPSSSSQVLPLASSPVTFCKPLDKNDSPGR